MDEKELVRKAQVGDFDAFGKLVDLHKAKVYAALRRLTGNDQDAEDLLQDTFLKAIDKIDQFRGEASFGTWLTAIALNEARALFARSKQAELKPVEAYLPVDGRGGEHNHESFRLFDWQDPHRVLEADELKRIIDQVIGELPFKYREAFVLRYIEELPVKEVAGLTGQTEASAKSRILRARLALIERLSQIFEAEYEQRMS